MEFVQKRRLNVGYVRISARPIKFHTAPLRFLEKCTRFISPGITDLIKFTVVDYWN